MKVELIDHTRYALELLLYTKNTRLQGGATLQDVIDWPPIKKMEHLEYMRDTIKSSWEFVNYTFEISGVTRAFTHQLVRTRNGRYAQESMRTVDVSENEIATPPSVSRGQHQEWFDYAMDVKAAYVSLINDGMPPQDARGILPTNITTSIIAQFSLRTLHEMAMVRLCTRTQGEYQDVFREMKQRVVEVHPWAQDFIQVACVATGNCAFPRYTECPIQRYTHQGPINIELHKKIKRDCVNAFENLRHEAVPRAKDGMTM